MGRVRFTVVTVDCDSGDSVLLEQLRALLPGVVVATPAPSTTAPTPVTPARAVANHLLEGSLQELCIEAVTERPGLNIPELSLAVLNEATPTSYTRISAAIAPLVTLGRLVRSSSGKHYTPAAAAVRPEFQGQSAEPLPAPPLPVRATAAAAAEACPEFPPCLGCRKGETCVGIVNVDKPANPAMDRTSELSSAAQELGRRGGVKGGAERARRMTREERSASAKEAARKRWARARGEDPGIAAATQADEQPPPRPRTESLIRQHLVEREATAPVLAPEPAIDVGKVAGVAAPAITPGSLTERIVALVSDKPGSAIPDLARELLGDASAASVRRIDMLTGPLVMAGKLARFNGRLYRDMKQAAAMKLPPPQQRSDLRRPGAGQAPLANVQKSKDVFDQVVAAFAEDHAVPLPDVARDVFGESTGRSIDKLQLMLRQLVASGRLVALGSGRYRPKGVEEAPPEEQDDEESDDAGDDDEPELESNGAPDEDTLEELDLS